MKILHVLRQYTPSVGGLENYVTALVREQQQLGHTCDILTLNKLFHGTKAKLPARDQINGAEIYRIPFIGKRRFFLPLLNPKRFAPYDVVHVHNTDPMYDVTAALKPLHKKPMVCTTHGGFFHTGFMASFKKVYFQTVTRAGARAYDRIVACSENDERIFRNISNRVVLVPNAVDPLGDFTATGSDFLYIGRLSENKQIDRLLTTHKELIFRHGPRHLHIVGPEFDVTRDQLQAQITALGIAPHVTVHGYLEQADLQTLAKTCGFFVSASRFEGFGMTLIEAMSVGLVPLVQPNASFQDLLRQADTGLLVDHADPADAADHIAHFIAGSQDANRLQARTFAKQFNWRALAEKMDNVYQEITAATR